jgi:hypothetical protein
MSAMHLKNISLTTLRKYLAWKGAKMIRITGGHEVWSRADLLRPIVIQSHIDPVPEFIVKQILRAFNTDKDDFINFLNS